MQLDHFGTAEGTPSRGGDPKSFSWNPQGPYPLLVLGGEAGSAKSTMARMLRQIVDPDSLPLRSFPQKERDFMIFARSSHVLCFDNLSGLDERQSDILCRVATGGGFGVRQLYSNFDEVRFNPRRPVILNGIDELAARPDLIDRALVITLPAIPPELRCAEATLLQNFDLARPCLVGALLNILVETVRELPSVVLAQAPRMADFARCPAAAERALGWPTGGFMEAFNYNRRAALQTGVESSVVASMVQSLMATQPEWVGTATALLTKLNALTGSSGVPRSLPRTAAQLSNELRRVAPALRAYGIDVAFGRSSDARRTRHIHLGRVGEAADLGSCSPSTADGDGRAAQFGFQGIGPDASDDPDGEAMGRKSWQ